MISLIGSSFGSLGLVSLDHKLSLEGGPLTFIIVGWCIMFLGLWASFNLHGCIYLISHNINNPLCRFLPHTVKPKEFVLMTELVLDVIEQILVRLDVIDLLRCKSVCKSWLSLISTPLFVKAHLNYTFIKNYEFRDKRIIMHDGCFNSVMSTFAMNGYHIVGSSNGLVCISPRDFELLVTNPLTREVNCLQKIPEIPKKTSPRIFCSHPCWGFGYDSSIDDYKVIAGFGEGKHRTRFHVLTLKSNTWKLIGDIKYKFDFPCAYRPGILCEGSLHWFMNDRKNKKVIISFDLSLEEFKEIPQPDDLLYKCEELYMLGFIEESLCIYEHQEPSTKIIGNKRFRDTEPRPRIWIMRSYQVTQSWEQAPYGCEAMDVDPHYLRSNPNKYVTHDSDLLAICRSIRIMDYMATPIFMQSLVSPHGNITRLIKTTNDNKDYMAAPIYVQSLVSSHGNITRLTKTTNDNKALKRKRRQAKNSKRNRNAQVGSNLSCYIRAEDVVAKAPSPLRRGSRHSSPHPHRRTKIPTHAWSFVGSLYRRQRIRYSEYSQSIKIIWPQDERVSY